MLKDFNVPIEEFHAKDIFPKAKGFFHPSKWSGDHQVFLSAIADAIARHPKIHPISAAIIVVDSNEIGAQCATLQSAPSSTVIREGPPISV